MSAAAFDSLAARYDELWTNTPVGRAQRELVWRHVDPLFRPGDRILDIGCGTGEDAAHFVSRGIKVCAADPSPAMREAARRRLGAEILPDWQAAAGVFDGAISNFGALNCESNLRAVGRELARLIRPGGRLALCVIGRFCLWETVYYAARLEFAKAFRRLPGSAESSLGLTVHYPAVRALRSALAPGFALDSTAGIGLFVPPSYVPLPAALVRLAAGLDRALAHLPLFRALADHRLLLFTRK